MGAAQGRRGRAIAGVLMLSLACACTSKDGAEPRPAPRSSSTGSAPESPERARSVRPGDLDAAVAMRVVRHLSGGIGPRHATSPAFERAARWVRRELILLGYVVHREGFDVPGGVSWGVPVAAGRSTNLVAAAPGTRLTSPHLVVAAHLDTVPQAPGAEDNASGVGVLLAVARALQEHRTRLPVVIVAFGAEEPRGPTDADHHYGSRAHVASYSPTRRHAVRGMVSLDRVGVGGRVPVCSALDPGDPDRARVLAAARRARVPAAPCINASSDHWSFERTGLPGVRLGGTPYAGYHSAADVPAVVDQRQLGRTGRIVLSWLAH